MKTIKKDECSYSVSNAIRTLAMIAPEELTNDQVMELLKIAFRQPEVALALAKMIHDLQERRSVSNPLE